jgi:hypothetical protein
MKRGVRELDVLTVAGTPENFYVDGVIPINSVTSPIVTADWKATNGGRWVVPFGGGIGRITRLGPQPVNITAQFYGNAVHPAGASPWSMRLQIQLLYPKKPKQT